MGRWLVAVLAAVVLILVTVAVVTARAGVGPLALNSGPHRPHLFIESYGRCPGHRPDKWPRPVCLWYKHFNATGGLLNPRTGPWGIAYSFNCGTKPGRFQAEVVFPDADGGFDSAMISRHALRGSGYHMETIANNTSRLPYWDQSEGIGIRSTCAWHVRAVEGSRRQVKARIPSLPPFWHLNRGKILLEDPNNASY